MFLSERERWLHKGEIGVIGNDGLGEGRELDTCLPSSPIFFTTF